MKMRMGCEILSVKFFYTRHAHCFLTVSKYVMHWVFGVRNYKRPCIIRFGKSSKLQASGNLQFMTKLKIWDLFLSFIRLKVSLCSCSLSPFGFDAAVTMVKLIGTVCFSIKFCKIVALGRIMSFTENWNLIIQLFLIRALTLLDFHWYDGSGDLKQLQ